MRTHFDYSKLKGRIKEKGYTLEKISKRIGISLSTLSLKMSNKSYFSQKEMLDICNILDIELKKIGDYFFCLISLEN